MLSAETIDAFVAKAATIEHHMREVMIPEQRNFTFSLAEIADGIPNGEVSRRISQADPGFGQAHAVIYTISAADGEVANSLMQYRNSATCRPAKYARTIPAHNTSRHLYVGSSHKFKTRMRQHLHGSSSGPYALNMRLWFPEVAEAPGEQFDIVVNFQRFADDIDQDVLQAFEDTLWDQLSPRFGRRGAR